MTKAERERKHQQDLQRLRGFRPIDDDFMRCLFKDNIPLAELVLRILIQKPDLIITECQTQKDMKRLAGARSICLDAYGTDSHGKKYDMEVQRDDKGADPHRARYHSSVMDVENLDAGQDFTDLPETFTLFLTEKDVYGAGAPVYPIERINLVTGKPFGDGEHILYVNGAYQGDSDIGKLMHDFNCVNADDMYFDLMAERTRYLKENPKGVSEMCKVIEEMRREEREEGFQEGRAEGIREGVQKGIQEGIQEGIQKGIQEGIQIGGQQKLRETALRMLAAGESDIQKIALYTSLSVDEINTLKADRVQ